jgi:cell wall-associated NlpC family hydrolase
MELAGSYAARNDVRYSQDLLLRTGPTTFDCSGFVATLFKKAGLEYTADGGGAPSVGYLVRSLRNPDSPFIEVTPTEARPGDLVVHEKANKANSDHVGVFAGWDGQHALEYSATIRGGDAYVGTAKEDAKNSIVKSPSSIFGKTYRILRWRYSK